MRIEEKKIFEEERQKGNDSITPIQCVINEIDREEKGERRKENEPLANECTRSLNLVHAALDRYNTIRRS